MLKRGRGWSIYFTNFESSDRQVASDDEKNRKCFLSSAQCDQIGCNFTTLATFKKLYLVGIWQTFEPTLTILLCQLLVKMLIVESGKIFKHRLAIWSHWQQVVGGNDKNRQRRVLCSTDEKRKTDLLTLLPQKSTSFEDSQFQLL